MNLPWKTSVLLLLFFALIVLAPPAQADRDIVYAARYYLPPGAHGTSHFHLYRINPDGTGKTQITFGSADDYEPAWSPDGRQILFTRDGQGVCLVAANSGTVRTLFPSGPGDANGWGSARWLPGGKTISVGHTRLLKRGAASEVLEKDTRSGKTRQITGATDELLSLDAKHAYLPDDNGDRILDRRTGAFSALASPLSGAAWADSQTLMGLTDDPKTTRWSLCVVGTDGRQTQQRELRFPAAFAGTGDDDPAERGGVVLTEPKNTLVFALDNHNSTVGTDFLFFRMPRDGSAMSYLTEGQFLAWSPDGSRFAVAPGRDTTNYDGKRSVWYAPLFVRAAGGGPMRQITPRLSDVIGADWR